jgi:hypothetical protein
MTKSSWQSSYPSKARRQNDEKYEKNKRNQNISLKTMKENANKHRYFGSPLV